MNIYQHVENVFRELESKLLLATLAAASGHQVIVSDLESTEKGIIEGRTCSRNISHQIPNPNHFEDY